MWGASVSYEITGRHYRAVLAFAGRTRFVVFPGSPSAGRGGAGARNCVQNLRKELRLLTGRATAT